MQNAERMILIMSHSIIAATRQRLWNIICQTFLISSCRWDIKCLYMLHKFHNKLKLLNKNSFCYPGFMDQHMCHSVAAAAAQSVLVLTALCICSSRLCWGTVWSQPGRRSHELDTATGPAGWRVNSNGHSPPAHAHTAYTNKLPTTVDIITI